MAWQPPAVGATAIWTRTFTQADVEAFAVISGDRNPLGFVRISPQLPALDG